MQLLFLLFVLPSTPSWPESCLAVLDDARDVKLLLIFHEIGEEDTRSSKLLLGGLKSPSHVDDESFAH